MLLGDVAQLWSSDYGRIALSKLGLVAVLLCFAAFNKLRLTPRLLAGEARAVRTLRSSLEWELLFGVLILAATATLTTIGGPPALD
jgi:putative copper export protein